MVTNHTTFQRKTIFCAKQKQKNKKLNNPKIHYDEYIIYDEI